MKIIIGKIKKLTNQVTKHENKQRKSVMMRKELDQLIKRKRTNKETYSSTNLDNLRSKFP